MILDLLRLPIGRSRIVPSANQCGQDETKQGVMNSVILNELEAINRLRDRAFRGGDIWDLIDLFVDDSVWMPMGDAAVEGKESVRAWATRFDGRIVKFRIIPQEVVVAGEWAFDRFVGIMTSISATDDQELESYCFQYFWTLCRQEDDSWKVVHWIWNEHPPIS